MQLFGLLSAPLPFPSRRRTRKGTRGEVEGRREDGETSGEDSPSLTTSPIEYSSSPTLPAGLTNSHEILTEAPVGGDMPIVDRAREVTVSVNFHQLDQCNRYIQKVVHHHARSIVSRVTFKVVPCDYSDDESR
jgi:hypothetical protein